MKISTIRPSNSNLSTDLLVLGASKGDLEGKRRGGSGFSFAALDAQLRGELSKNVKRARFDGKQGSSYLASTLNNSTISSALVVGTDQEETTNNFDSIHFYRKLGSTIVEAAKKIGAVKVAFNTQGFRLDKEINLHALIEGLILSKYEFIEYRSKKEKISFLADLLLISDKNISASSLQTAQELCASTILARDLINLPPNVCTPKYLVKTAQEIAKKGKLKFQVFDKAQLEKMGAHSLLCVAKGSEEPPYLIKLTYTPKVKTKKTKVISLVGKGVTFDSGGLSIKPADSMETMKCDMSGAAAVLGVMQAVSRLQPKAEVRGYIPTTENMINGKATRPSDIVTAMNGKTIEIVNTDAEGRLILADALTLACRDKADITIDIATLTGACMVALGMKYAGVFTDDEKLSQEIIKLGEISGERYWRLPLAYEYKELIKSKYADMKNSGGRWGGAITAALFLKEFVENTRWAHLDIAGPADTDRGQDHITIGGVGFAVRTLTRFVFNQ